MNKELWKQMNFSQRVEWLVQYYGVTVLVVIVAVVVALSLGRSFFGAKERGDMRVIILDNGVSSELCNQYQEEISQRINGVTEMSAYVKNDPTHMQAFSVRLTADDLDIVIAPEEEMRQMAGNGYLIPYEATGVTGFFADYPKEDVLTVRAEGMGEVTVAVRLNSNSRYMTYRREAGAKEEEAMYLGVTIKKINDENIESTARYFLDE